MSFKIIRNKYTLSTLTIFLFLCLSYFFFIPHIQNMNLNNENPNFIQRTISKLGFSIDTIIVEGNNFMDSSEVLEDIDIVHKFIYGVKLSTVKDAFSQNPWVKDVLVLRKLPGLITIKIIEREPVAIFLNENIRHLVDINGYSIAEDNIGVFLTLVQIKGEGVLNKIPNLLNIINSESLITKLVHKATWVGNRRWDITLTNQTVIKLPEENPLEAWRYAATLQQKKAVLTNNSKIVDLRIKGKIFLHNYNNQNT
ncbi:cell division protein FtsQ [Candidatus Xenohaliotis californiensis]|uniref:Cell division protein FtsQ n=1 Tax=Candidatus Xenohaliotis californiensis TaxID=84677 RepID=A0ABP0EYD4_9RICK|nr:cell division protein FtsQ [Candidatus Xenohaliotis californiensis]